MKKMKNLAVLVTIVMTCAVLVSCGEGYSYDEDLPEKVEPTAPRDTTKVDPTPDPTTPADTIQWKTVGEKTLHVDENRLVTSKIFGLKYNGTVDSLVLNYILKFQLSATDTVRLTTPGTELTAYAGPLSFPGAQHERFWEGKDSLEVVTTTKGYKTSYFDVVWVTSHTLGWTIIKGQPEPYKYDIESSIAVFNGNSLQRYCEPYEVERGDSVYLREEIRNVVQMTFHRHTFVEEKKVVVDHFLKMKEAEKEPEPEKVEADEWVTGLGRLVSLTKCLREDSRLWCDVALLEGGDGYTMIIDTYDTDGGYVGREKKFISFEVCPKSNDYEGVSYVNGGFYPATITYDAKSRGWLLVSNVSGNALTQSIKASDAVARGIKNFKENNTAYPWPYLTNTSTSKEVNGKKVIEVSGKTSIRAYRGCIVADSSLK